MRRRNAPVLTRTLPGRYQQLVGMNGQALDVIGVPEIVALRLLVDVVKHDGGGDEINDLAGRKLVEV